MGHTRVDTITKLNTSPVEQHEAIVKEYAVNKLKKLQEKHKDVGQEDIFDQVDRSTVRLLQQFQIAQTHLTNHVADKSPQKIAKLSEDYFRIAGLPEEFDAAQTVEEHIEVYSKLMSCFFTESEPLAKDMASETLKNFVAATPPDHQSDFMARPLAVAIGLHCEGVPTSRKHRNEVREFVKTHFTGDLAEAGKGVNAMLETGQRAETAKILTAYRAFLAK